MSISIDDNRILWIKRIVYNYFDLKSDEVFAEFLQRDNEINRIYLERFLDCELDLKEISVLFMIKTGKETIFEEVEIPIEIQEEEDNSPESSVSPQKTSNNRAAKNVEQSVPSDEAVTQLIASEDDVKHFRKANAIMPSYFEIVFATGSWLYQLHSILSKVYSSCLSTIELTSFVDKPKLSDAYRNDEFPLKYHKFLQVVSESSDLLRSGNEFKVPPVDLEGDEHAIIKNEKISNLIESAVIQWGHKIREIIDELKSHSTQGRGPLAEIEYWRDRATSLGRLVEEAAQPRIQRVLYLYALNERISSQSVFEPLHRCHIEATDNVKFLELVERYFKIMTYCADINEIVESLCPLMQALQMIWIISPYYSKNDHMSVIFERIAWCLCDRVSRMLTPNEIFKMSLDNMLPLINNGRTLLESWKSTYMDRRADIEASGREYRWEFDKNRLFAKSDYMITVCNDMEEAVLIMKEYETMFGPEIKSMVSDQKHFDLLAENILKLPKFFEMLTFNPFDLENKSKWQSQMQQFQMEVVALDADAKGCLEDSFRTLRSSNEAFRVLQRLLESHPRKDIAGLFEERYIDILERYDKEVRLIETTFVEGSADAGHFAAVLGPRYFPPVSSAISWVRHLQARITSPMLKMLRIGRLMESDRGKEVQDRYLCLIRRMTQFEEDLFSNWCQQVNERLRHLMERKLWKNMYTPKHIPTMKSSRKGSLAVPLLKKSSAFGRELPKQTKSLYKFNFEVDFGEELIQIIAETKFLQMFGFPVPDLACCVALKEKELLRQRLALGDLANSVCAKVGGLSAIELVTLDDHLSKLWTALEPAWKQLNWTSLIIDRFLAKANEAFSRFCKLLRVLEKAKAKIETNLREISKASLFDMRSSLAKSSELCAFKVYLKQMMDHRAIDFENLAKKHTEISTILLNLEKDITGRTPTGKDPVMIYFFEHWEWQCFDTVHQMVVNNLKEFLHFLQNPKGPLFAVDLILSGSEVVSAPQPTELYQLMVQDVRDAIKSAQVFVRWQPRTCLASRGIKVSGQEDLVYFTFHDDVIKSTTVKHFFNLIDRTVFQAAEMLKRHQEKYRQYDHLFTPHKKSTVEKWRICDPTVAQINQRIYDITTEIKDLRSSINDFQIGFFTLRTNHLVEGLRRHSEKWTSAYGDVFRDRIFVLSRQLRDTVRNFQSRLQDQPTDRVHLQSLLSTLRDINDARAESEEQLAGIEECRLLLRQYGLQITSNEEMDFKSVRDSWIDLLKQAKVTKINLNRPRKKFKYATKVEANQFAKTVNEFLQRFESEGPMNTGENLDRGLVLMKQYNEELQNLTGKYHELLSAERLFDLPASYLDGLNKAQKQMESLELIYRIYSDQKALVEEWSKVLWRDAHFPVLQNELEQLQQALQKISKQARQMEVAKALKAYLASFADSLTLLSDLKNEALRQRHWTTLMKITKHDFALTTEEITLGNIFDMHLSQFRTEIDEVLSTALKEFTIEKEFSDLNESWKGLHLEIKEYSPEGTRRSLIIAGLEEVMQTLDDSCISLQSMGGSRFAAPFMDEISRLEKEIAIASEVLDVWIMVQRKWFHLEGVFAGGDIHSRLPKEAEKFDKLNLVFRKTVEEASKNPFVCYWCLKPGRVTELQSISAGFDNCQKSLTDYLKTKRSSFPRFFFISDDELLTILGSNECNSIQEYLIKMFDNITRLEFTINEQNISIATGMISSEGEKMTFRKPVECHGRIEDWMTKAENEMRQTNRLITKEAIYRYRESTLRVNWALRYQGMAVLAASQVWWTWEIEDAFRRLSTAASNHKQDKSAMKTFAKQQLNQLEEIVQRVRGDLSPIDRTKLTTLLIIDVHSRDVVDGFVRDSIIESNEFEWQSQLRSYWSRSSDHLLLRQCNGSFDYGYEYMGLNGRLVITPLTDRIYLTLTQALSMHLGGCAAGPAGTGKTETVKDLAKAIATFCLVTNCGDTMDYRSIGRIFSGLCQTGAWGCFDEFNRIEISVLSVISTQLRLIQTAHIQSARKFLFEGEEIKFNPRVGIFITMNPGYAGRTELPESVKVHFRQVVVAVPDRQMICEVILFAQGFSKARMLAIKAHTLYHLAERQLSKQYHYDFSMRTLKAVLQMAGELRRREPESDEISVIIRALRGVNLPKLLHEDVRLFLDLIGDLFPGLSSPKSEDKEFSDAIEDWLSSEKYIVTEKQVEKVVQLRETMQTRHATMVIGPTCGGKSVVIKAYCGAQKKLGTTTNLITLNPKDRSVAELYGVLDPNTRDWTDGLLSRIFRVTNKWSQIKENNIILFDGDVDTLWVENMNSVMDDNRLLTLPNGERIRLQSNCCILFEVGHLEFASLATISRCGMVYISSQSLEYSAVWQRWKLIHKNMDDFYIQILDNLFKKYLPRLMTLSFNYVVPLTPVGLVNQLCYLLESLLIGVAEASADCLEAIFIQALTFSIGSCLLGDSDRAAFHEKIKELSGLPSVSEEISGDGIQAGFFPGPSAGLENFYFDVEKKAWIPWESMVPHYRHDPSINFTEIVVPTKETVIMRWILEKNLQVDRPVLLVGHTGTSKTASINQFLMEQDKLTHQIIRASFSFRTVAKDLFNCLDANLEKRSKSLYGPVAGKRLLLFVDDIHMPEIDPYGTQQPLAFLKLLLTNQGFYDRSSSDLKWRRVCDVSYIASMATPSRIDPRCLSLFSVFHAAPLSEVTLFTIFSSILLGHVQTGFKVAIADSVAAITKATLNVYGFLLQKMHATPVKFHYVFNFRDLRRVCGGLCRMSPDRISTLPQVARLWRHEMLRVFVDRLITEEDITIVKSLIDSEAEKLDSSAKGDILNDPILFGEYNTGFEEGELPYYEDMGDYSAVKAIFSDLQERYSEHSRLVLFNDALEHLSRLHRILSTTGGHGLCVGTSGSGKTVLIKLAALAANCEIFQITLSRNYSEKDFQEEVKTLYLRLVLENKQMVFLVSEDDIINEAFLDIINRMLVGTDVSSLFSDEEREHIADELQEEVMKAGSEGTKEIIWDYFSRRASKNLHVVLSMSPEGNSLRRRCINFPGLLTSTTIDWFFAWPEEALQAVAKATITSENPLIPAIHYDALIEHVVHVHRSSEKYTQEFTEKWKRNNFVTPKHFLDYITNYLRLLSENDQSILALCDRFTKGVEKLDDASIQIKEINEKLVVQRVAITEKTEACETLLKDISNSQNIAAEKQMQSSQKAKEMEAQSKEIEHEKKAAESALAEALPALEQARAALSELDKNDVTEIRSFVKPPRPVQVVSECICVFKGLSEISWKSAKGMMADTNFLQSLQTMDIDAIGPKQLSTVKEHLEGSKVSLEQMQSVSKAGAGFLRFLHAVLGYCDVLKDVRPKREKVSKLGKLFSQNEHDLDRINRELSKVEEDIKQLNERLSTAKAEQSTLQEETKIMERRLAAADKLISGLRSESVRWRAEIAKLLERRQHLLGDCLVSAAFLAYTGPFPQNFRQRMLHNDWLPDLQRRGIPHSEDFKFVPLLTDEVTVANWNADGLPGDEFSVQNGIITTRASRFPLFIDPQQQALKWIKNMEEQNNLRVATFNDPDFLKYLELAIKFGTPFLFEDVYDYIDPIIQNILSKNILGDKNRPFVMLGDKEVEFDSNFRLYLNTKLSNPAYGPKIFGNAVVINCTITEEALENQLLDVIVNHEQISLEEKKNMLIHTISENRKILKDLEDSLLLNLTLSTGNILDNEELIATVDETKHKATDTEEKLSLAANTAAEVEVLSNAYRPAAKHGALLFLILTDMATISPMYQFALTAYLKLFETALHRSTPDTWFSSNKPEVEPPPYFGNLTSFRKLCLLRCFREDRICRAVERFVAESLGENFMSSHEPNLTSIYEQSQCGIPVVFILSPGSDPTESLKKSAKSYLDLNPSVHLKFLSMGQGQETAALKLFKSASSEGSWLILQNCHLLVKWIPQLEKAIESTKQFHPHFRLWITTEPSPDFPVGFLQKSLKVVTEPLVGLKRNLRATFLEIPASTFAECQHSAFPTLAYTLSFFHAVVQERRQYGKLGWNIPYDFNLSDFHASLAVILDQLKSTSSGSGISWGSLRYLINEIMYGGRVIDEFDRRVLRTYVNEYFGEFLFDESQHFHFYVNKKIMYTIPPDASREGILRYIDSLPTNSSPEVLGLHANAEIDSFTAHAHTLWGHLLSLRREGRSGDPVPGDTTLTLEFIERILQSLPLLFDREALKESLKDKMTPTTVVLLQELVHFNRLIHQMESSLTDLKRALSGEIGLSNDLEEMATSLRNGHLPSSWRNLAPETRKSLANWLSHFQRRLEQYKAWITSGEPMVIWLSGLHVPESYLSAIVQSVCRRNAWPLDKSAMITTVTDYTDPGVVEDRNVAGCLLDGLFLEGAAWSSKDRRLCLQAPRQLIQPLPLLSVRVVESRRVKKQMTTLKTPVYVTSTRASADSRSKSGSGLVFEADLAIGREKDASYWILQGVCLILSDD
ncbi:hypothetical protein Aperf_G00000039574 [Anoplocephala perfoliata]